jgi:hypothetical protein
VTGASGRAAGSDEGWVGVNRLRTRTWCSDKHRCSVTYVALDTVLNALNTQSLIPVVVHLLEVNFQDMKIHISQGYTVGQ